MKKSVGTSEKSEVESHVTSPLLDSTTCPISYAVTWISTRDLSLASRLHGQAVNHGSFYDDSSSAQFCSLDDARIQLWAALKAGKLLASADFVGSENKARVGSEVVGSPMAAHTWTTDLEFNHKNGLDSLIDHTTDPPTQYIYVHLRSHRILELWKETSRSPQPPSDGLSEKRRGGFNTQKANISGLVKAWIREDFEALSSTESVDARKQFETEMVRRYVDDVSGSDGRIKATTSNTRENTKVKGDASIRRFVRALFAKSDDLPPESSSVCVLSPPC